MKFEDMEKSILSYVGSYEKERGIKTLSVNLIAGSKRVDWVIYDAPKSDGSVTLFFAYKNKRSSDDYWWWFCPSKDHIDGVNELIKIYHIIDCRNKSIREPQGDRLHDYMGANN